jgi:hypothetical protein
MDSGQALGPPVASCSDDADELALWTPFPTVLNVRSPVAHSQWQLEENEPIL